MFLCETLPPKVSLQKYMIYRWSAYIFQERFLLWCAFDAKDVGLDAFVSKILGWVSKLYLVKEPCGRCPKGPEEHCRNNRQTIFRCAPNDFLFCCERRTGLRPTE